MDLAVWLISMLLQNVKFKKYKGENNYDGKSTNALCKKIKRTN